MSSAMFDFSSPVQILSCAAANGFHEKQLRLDEACHVMEVLQNELDRLRTHKDAQRRGYLKLIRHLNRVYGVLPPSMFLTGLTRESSTAVAGGGFADVWIGRLNKQRVCIKVLRFFQQGSDREKLLKALSKEVLLWRQLNHPNILPFLGVNTALFAPSFCIVSPWMSNGDIMAYTRNLSLDLGAKLHHISEIAEGLLYLHGLDPPVIHGDIKGANILISNNHHCCLADFGLSVLDSQSMNPTVTATAQGSLRWLAPEFISPTPMPTQGKLTSRDIYAFGCTMFEILTGQPPFSHLNLDITVAIDVLKGARPVLSPDVVPKEAAFKLIRALLDLCWAEKITHRPDAQTVLDSLKYIQGLFRGPEVEYLSSLLPVLNFGASGMAPNLRHAGHDTKPALRDRGLGIDAAADALNSVGANCTSSSLGGLGVVHSSSKRAVTFTEVLPEPLASFSSGPVVYPATTFPQHQGPPASNFGAPMQDRSATHATTIPRGMTEEWNYVVEEETVPSGTPFKQSRPTFIGAQVKAPAVQLTPGPRFEVSFPTVVSHPTQKPLRLLPRQFLSPSSWTYGPVVQEDDMIQDRISTPFNEALNRDDGDDKIVWDPRPRAVTTTTFSSLSQVSPLDLRPPCLATHDSIPLSTPDSKLGGRHVRFAGPFDSRRDSLRSKAATLSAEPTTIGKTLSSTRLNANASSFNTSTNSRDAATTKYNICEVHHNPTALNPFFGTHPIKSTPAVVLKDDFNPFKHDKVVDASRVSARWPYHGKQYRQMFPVPQHIPKLAAATVLYHPPTYYSSQATVPLMPQAFADPTGPFIPAHNYYSYPQSNARVYVPSVRQFGVPYYIRTPMPSTPSHSYFPSLSPETLRLSLELLPEDEDAERSDNWVRIEEGGLSWANPELWEVWKEYRNRQGHPEPGLH